MAEDTQITISFSNQGAPHTILEVNGTKGDNLQVQTTAPATLEVSCYNEQDSSIARIIVKVPSYNTPSPAGPPPYPITCLCSRPRAEGEAVVNKLIVNQSMWLGLDQAHFFKPSGEEPSGGDPVGTQAVGCGEGGGE